jgi:hypothetical protein
VRGDHDQFSTDQVQTLAHQNQSIAEPVSFANLSLLLLPALFAISIDLPLKTTAPQDGK